MTREIVHKEEKYYYPSDYKELFHITPLLLPTGVITSGYDNYILSIEDLLGDIIPQDLYKKASSNPCYKTFHDFYVNLPKESPIITFSDITSSPCCFSFTTLCYGEFTHGTGRFIADMLSKWLIPGKNLALTGNRSLAFTFKLFSQHKYFITENFVALNDDKEVEMAKKNLQYFIKEIRLNMLSVYHARQIISMNRLSLEQKSAMIQDNILTLLKKPKKNYNTSAFDQMQNFLIKLSAEKKLSEIEQNLAYLMQKKPNTFDRDIFNAIHHMMYIFNDNFTAIRDPRHISRIIGLQYLFRKMITQALYNEPNKRHIVVKLLKTRVVYDQTPKIVLGLLITLNFMNEAEKFEKSHILETIWYCIQDVQYINKSYIADVRDEKIRSYYLEVEKSNLSNFSFEEIKTLRKRLPQELKNRVVNPVHPIFMPRNEEEILRNIILLSKQLKYVRDLPQVIITYEKQTGYNISFNVILVRLLKPNVKPLKQAFTSSNTFLKYTLEEVKKIGYLKKKYPKEANLFKVSVNNKRFFRSDKSLDLQKARQCVSKELVNILGDFRDYNGGMILKQSQAFDSLKEIVTIKNNESLLENFFYSLRPGVMQSIIPSTIIKHLFSLLISILKNDFDEKPFYYQMHTIENYFLVSIASNNPTFKDETISAIKNLNIPSFELTQSSLEVNKIETLNFIYRSHDTKHFKSLETTIKHHLTKFSEKPHIKT
jgi:hypothetical protein